MIMTSMQVELYRKMNVTGTTNFTDGANFNKYNYLNI